MNSSKNDKRVKVGQLLWIKLMRSPLMCEPSWSWSVMIITWPYLRVFRSSSDEYFLLYCRPRILMRLLISALSIIWNHTFCQLHLGCVLLHNLCCSLFLVEFRIARIQHGMSLQKKRSDHFFFSYSVQSTLAMQTPCYYGHSNNTDSKVYYRHLAKMNSRY